MDNKMNAQYNNQLANTIRRTLTELEESDDIVLCSNVPDLPTKILYDELHELLSNEALSSSELSGIRSLIFEAINHNNFFDREMPTLTGFTAEEFKKISEKLPKG